VRNAYKMLVRKSEDRRQLGRPRRSCKDNIRMNLREIGWKDVEWTHLAQDREQCRAVVNTIMNIRVPKKAGNFFARRGLKFSRWNLLHVVGYLVSYKYEGVTKSFRTGRLELELQMVQLSVTKYSCIAIL